MLFFAVLYFTTIWMGGGSFLDEHIIFKTLYMGVIFAHFFSSIFQRGHHGSDRMVVGIPTTQLPVQSVTITTNVVSSNPIHGEVYSIQHYVMKVC